jgi:hypothetical protein
MHEKQFTRQELRDLVFDVLLPVVDKAVEVKKQETLEYVRECKENNLEPFALISRDMQGKDLKFSEIYQQVAEALCKQHNFTKIKYTTEFSVFGWANIFEDEGWERERGDSDFTALYEFLKLKRETKE